MNLEAARNDVISLGFYTMLKDIEVRTIFFEIFKQTGDPIRRTCMNCLWTRYKSLEKTSLINVLPMSKRKYRFKGNQSIRKFNSDILYSNLNLTDKIAEELLADEHYKQFIELNPEYKEEESTEAEDEEKQRAADLRTIIEEATGEKPGPATKLKTLEKKVKQIKTEKERVDA